MFDPIARWMRRHDPESYALHKAIKAAIVVTIGLAIGTLVIGSSELSTFASFGGAALLLFADFPGGKAARLGAYLGTVGAGVVLIVLGTLASSVPWVAVAGMAVAGFVVLFSGILSAAAAGASRALLLSFILPVTFPGGLADVPSRLAGWFIAAVLTIPLAVWVWPPKDHNLLRIRAAEACTALAHQLAARADPTGSTTVDAANTAAEEAIIALRRQFRSTTFRPVGLTTGSRVLMRLTDRLEWLRSVVLTIPPDDGHRWPERAERLVGLSIDVLHTCSDVLTATGRHRIDARHRLGAALQELDRQRADVDIFLRLVTTGGVEQPPMTGADARSAIPSDDAGPALRASMVHELAYTTHLAGETVAISAAADARPLVDRLLGRHAPAAVDGPVAAAQRILSGHITRRSVWFQNSIRGALGLSIAVLMVEVTEVSHGFWVVLGAMSVLRSSALNTRTTALRALLGTFVGFLVGAALILLVGTTPWHLWLLLPVAVFVAGYMPEAVSFIAGQAAFTVMVVVLFNIIQPVGWSVGLVRVEDIALGCAAGVVSGILLWPHGAAAQIRSTLAESYRRSSQALTVAVQQLSGPATENADADSAIDDAKAAAARVDDAVREYLMERGGKTVRIAELTAVLNGSGRLRLAAEAIGAMSRNGRRPGFPAELPGVAPMPPPTPAPDDDPTGTLAAAQAVLAHSVIATSKWFDQVGDVIDKTRTSPPAANPATTEDSLLDTFRQHIPALSVPAVAVSARTLWGASLYVDDVTRAERRLSTAISGFNAKSGTDR